MTQPCHTTAQCAVLHHEKEARADETEPHQQHQDQFVKGGDRPTGRIQAPGDAHAGVRRPEVLPTKHNNVTHLTVQKGHWLNESKHNSDSSTRKPSSFSQRKNNRKKFNKKIAAAKAKAGKPVARRAGPVNKYLCTCHNQPTTKTPVKSYDPLIDGPEWWQQGLGKWHYA